MMFCMALWKFRHLVKIFVCSLLTPDGFVFALYTHHIRIIFFMKWNTFFYFSPLVVIRKKFGLCQPPSPKIFCNFYGIHLFFGERGESVKWQLINYVVCRIFRLKFNAVFITTLQPQLNFFTLKWHKASFQ